MPRKDKAPPEVPPHGKAAVTPLHDDMARLKQKLETMLQTLNGIDLSKMTPFGRLAFHKRVKNVLADLGRL